MSLTKLETLVFGRFITLCPNNGAGTHHFVSILGSPVEMAVCVNCLRTVWILESQPSSQLCPRGHSFQRTHQPYSSAFVKEITESATKNAEHWECQNRKCGVRIELAWRDMNKPEAYLRLLPASVGMAELQLPAFLCAVDVSYAELTRNARVQNLMEDKRDVDYLIGRVMPELREYVAKNLDQPKVKVFFPVWCALAYRVAVLSLDLVVPVRSKDLLQYERVSMGSKTRQMALQVLWEAGNPNLKECPVGPVAPMRLYRLEWMSRKLNWKNHLYPGCDLMASFGLHPDHDASMMVDQFYAYLETGRYKEDELKSNALKILADRPDLWQALGVEPPPDSPAPSALRSTSSSTSSSSSLLHPPLPAAPVPISTSTSTSSTVSAANPASYLDKSDGGVVIPPRRLPSSSSPSALPPPLPQTSSSSATAAAGSGDYPSEMGGMRRTMSGCHFVPVGLRNFGSTCYISSLMQAYFAVPEVRDAILSAKPNQEDGSPDVLVAIIQDLFAELLTCDKSIESRNIIYLMRALNLSQQQHDMEELQEKLHAALENSCIGDAFTRLFTGREINQTVEAIGHAMGPAAPHDVDNQPFTTIILHTRVNDVTSNLQNHVEWELQEDAKPRCFRRRLFASFPDIITFSISRFKDDLTKDNGPVMVEEYLDLSPFTSSVIGELKEKSRDLDAVHRRIACYEDSGLAMGEILRMAGAIMQSVGTLTPSIEAAMRDASKITANKAKEVLEQKETMMKEIVSREQKTRRNLFRLLAIGMHCGTVQSGHYFVYVRDMWQDNVWWIIDDSFVQKVGTEEVLQAASGIDMDQPEHKRSNAYWLLYRRDNLTTALPEDRGRSKITVRPPRRTSSASAPPPPPPQERSPLPSSSLKSPAHSPSHARSPLATPMQQPGTTTASKYPSPAAMGRTVGVGAQRSPISSSAAHAAYVRQASGREDAHFC